MPFLKVACVDTEEALQLVTDHKLPISVMLEKRTELLNYNPRTSEIDITKCVSLICVDARQYKLAKKLLLTNSRRIRQGHSDFDSDEWFWESFIQLLFHRGSNVVDDSDTQVIMELSTFDEAEARYDVGRSVDVQSGEKAFVEDVENLEKI